MVNLVLEGALLGLASSFHCMIMCGPIALALPLDRTSSSRIIQGITFNQTGRILTYSILGGIGGAFGFQLPLFNGFQIATVLTGIAFLLVIWKPQWIRKMERQPVFLSRFRQRKMGELLQRKTNSNLFFLGVLNGLLPCALVLVAFGIAVTQGSVLNGVIFMLSYGLGTVPGISLVAFLGGRMLQQIPWKVRRLAPLAFSLIALVMIVRGLNLGIPYLSPKMEQTNQLTEARKMPHQVICK